MAGLNILDIDFTNVQVGSHLIGRPIGSGGFATVWSAREVSTKRWRAVKLFLIPTQRDSRFRPIAKMIEADYEPLMHLEHHDNVPLFFSHDIVPGIVSSTGGTGHFANEFVPQTTAPTHMLHALVFQFINRGSISNRYLFYAQHNPRRFLHELGELVALIRACHESTPQYLHCDIKPANILWGFSERSRLYLSDWGISLKLQKGQMIDRPIGSLPYMAPEAFESSIAEPDRDIYALACTIYEIYSGRRAFELEQAAVSTKPDLLDDYRKLHTSTTRPWLPDVSLLPISAEMAEVVYRAMSPAAQFRPSAAEIQDALTSEPNRLLSPRIRPAPRSATRIPRYGDIGFGSPIGAKYRVNELKEAAYIISLHVGRRDSKLLTALYELLTRYYDTSFTCLEVFGRADFIIRVWDQQDSPRLGDFLEDLLQLAYGNAADSVVVDSAKSVFFLKEPLDYVTLSQDVNARALLLGVHAAECGTNTSKRLAEYATWAASMLRKNHILLRAGRNPFAPRKGKPGKPSRPNDCVPCCTFVQLGLQQNNVSKRVEKARSLVQAIVASSARGGARP